MAFANVCVARRITEGANRTDRNAGRGTLGAIVGFRTDYGVARTLGTIIPSRARCTSERTGVGGILTSWTSSRTRAPDSAEGAFRANVAGAETKRTGCGCGTCTVVASTTVRSGASLASQSACLTLWTRFAIINGDAS